MNHQELLAQRLPTSLNAAVAHWAAEDPDRPYLMNVDGEPLTFERVDQLGRTWAGLLNSVGVHRGDRVAIMAPPSTDWVVAWLGSSWLRAYTVGVNCDYVGSMLRYVLEQSGANVLILDKRFVDRVSQVLPDLPGLRQLIVLGDVETSLPPGFVSAEAMLENARAMEGLEPPGAMDVVGLTYTSGTTGASKGAVTTWAHLHYLVLNGTPGDEITQSDIFYVPFSFNHVAGTSLVYQAAYFGCLAVIRESFKTSVYWDDIRRYGGTVSCLVGTALAFLMKEPERETDVDNPLRLLLLTPAPQDVAAVERRFGFRMWTIYATTEIGTCTLTGLSPDVPGTCGRLRPGYELRLVDSSGNDVADGQPGEAWVRSDIEGAMMLEYFDMPAETAAATHDGWFRTGDLLRRDPDGNYYYVDRIKDALRRRGENISSREVEKEILSHSEVMDAAVIGVPSEYGEDEVMAFVQLRPGGDVGVDELHLYLTDRLPRFMIPRFYDVVEDLPRTVSGRVRKVELRERGVSATTWDSKRVPS